MAPSDPARELEPELGCLCTAGAIGTGELYALLARNRARLTRYFPGAARAGESLARTRDFLAHQRTRETRQEALLFGVRGAEGALSGLVFVSRIDPDTGIAEVGGFVDQAAEGTGLMTRAMRAVFGWCRDEFGLVAIRFLIDPANARARALAASLGFVPERRDGRPFRRGTAFAALLEYHRLTF